MNKNAILFLGTQLMCLGCIVSIGTGWESIIPIALMLINLIAYIKLDKSK